MYQQELIQIGKRIIQSNGAGEEITSARMLSDFFTRIRTTGPEGPEEHSKNETLVQGGIALSPFDAASCTQDFLRTTRFIKGTYRAICELLIRFPGERLNVLYAGCGPYATLILPVLNFFEYAKINLFLIDINKDSVSCLKEILERFDMKTYVHTIVQGDATTYKQPVQYPLHLVLTETMFEALTREPQVAITSNLVPQLRPGGIFLPEAIELKLVSCFYAKEPYLRSGPDVLKQIASNSLNTHTHISLDTLLILNKETASEHLLSRPFESAWYPVPPVSDLCPDLCLHTTVRIYGGMELNTADSFITNPVCITSLSTLAGHGYFKLSCDFNSIPDWKYELRG